MSDVPLDEPGPIAPVILPAGAWRPASVGPPRTRGARDAQRPRRSAMEPGGQGGRPRQRGRLAPAQPGLGGRNGRRGASSTTRDAMREPRCCGGSTAPNTSPARSGTGSVRGRGARVPRVRRSARWRRSRSRASASRDSNSSTPSRTSDPAGLRSEPALPSRQRCGLSTGRPTAGGGTRISTASWPPIHDPARSHGTRVRVLRFAGPRETPIFITVVIRVDFCP